MPKVSAPSPMQRIDLISIIVPIFNSERYLERCIESLLRQDYSNTEIILVNDGSTDNSQSICERYASDHPHKIRVIKQDNQGASIARKRGIANAAGEYLMFVDSDDYVSNEYVSALYKALLKHNTSIALCPVKRVEIGAFPIFAKAESSLCMYKRELMCRFFKYEFWGYPGGCYHKKIFENIIFPEATVNEDYYVKAQMFASQDFVAYIDCALYYYEQHQDSLSKLPLSLRALGEFDNTLATWEYIKKNTQKYSLQALAIASEAACKWLGTINSTDYIEQPILLYRNRIKQFIRKNLLKILYNPHLLWKIKVVILYNYIGTLYSQSEVISFGNK